MGCFSLQKTKSKVALAVVHGGAGEGLSPPPPNCAQLLPHQLVLPQVKDIMDDHSPPRAALSNNISATPRPMPLPLPTPVPLSCYHLPLPHHPIHTNIVPTSTSTSTGPTIILSNNGSPLKDSGDLFQPAGRAKLKPQILGRLQSFKYEEIASACRDFSPDLCLGQTCDSCLFYGTIKKNRKGIEIVIEVDILRFCDNRRQGYYKEWLSDLSKLSQQHYSPHLCRLIGYCGGTEEGNCPRILIYKRSPRSRNLDKGLLSTPIDSTKGGATPLNWPARIKISMGVAQGLSHLHKALPNMVPYQEFRAFHIQVDSSDFGVNLSGYSMQGTYEASDVDNKKSDDSQPPEMEQHQRDCVSHKSNVWNFGVILLELLTGRRHMDQAMPTQERNLIKWARPFLLEKCRLFLIMDPKLQGRFPLPGVKMVVDLAMQCINPHPLLRPTMCHVSHVLKAVLDMRYSLDAHDHHFITKPITFSSPTLTSKTTNFPKHFHFTNQSQKLVVEHEVCSRQSRQIIVEHVVEEDKEEEDGFLTMRRKLKNDGIPQLQPLVIPKHSCASTYVLGDATTSKLSLLLESVEGC